MGPAAVEWGELRCERRNGDLGERLRCPTAVAVYHANRPHMPVERQFSGALMEHLAVDVAGLFGSEIDAERGDASARLRRRRSSRSAAACGSFGVGTERVMRVSADGQMTLTVIPLEAFSIATMRARATIPNLAAP